MKNDMLQSRQEGRKASFIKSILKRVFIAALIVCTAFNIPFVAKKSSADSLSQVNVRIDYLEELAYITNGTGGSSTKFYMSTDNGKNWDLLDYGVADISTILKSKDIVVLFKGNKDTKQVAYPLLGEDKTALTVAYQVVSGLGRIVYTSAQPVEYRKGANGPWRTATNLMSTSPYEIKGVTLYFRTVATAAKRAGKVISVKVPKRPSAPSIKVDGSKLRITGMKSGVTQYRIGDNTTWNLWTAPTSKLNYIDLSVLGGSTTTNIPITAGVIEFRTQGSDKKLSSAVRVVEVPQQRVMASTAASVTGSALTIYDTTKTAYEYAIVANGRTLDLSTAKWKSVSKNNKTIIIPKVSVQDKILVRLKSIIDPTTKQIIPASTYVQYTVTGITPR